MCAASDLLWRAALSPHLLLSVFRLFLTEPQLRRRGILALLIFAAFSMLWSSMVLPLTALSRLARLGGPPFPQEGGRQG